jgi:hypothetical protein
VVLATIPRDGRSPQEKDGGCIQGVFSGGIGIWREIDQKTENH